MVYGHHGVRKPKRRYIRPLDVQKLAEDVFTSSRKGITFLDVITKGLAKHKPQAQLLLKRSRSGGFLFTFKDTRPQRYYATSINSEVMKYLLSENAPIDHTGVNAKLEELRQDVRFQTLIEYVLPMLPEAPLGIHNLRLHFNTTSGYYDSLALIPLPTNRGKRSQQPIGENMVTCIVYPNTAVDIQIACSNKPFRVESLIDVVHLVAFLGEVRAYVCNVLSDTRGRAIPRVLDWMLTECDINKDVAVSDAFLIASLHIQGKVRVSDFEYVLRMYFKVMGSDTVFRTETGVAPHMRVGQILAGLFGLRAYVPEN
jgi:hypothetical protein